MTLIIKGEKAKKNEKRNVLKSGIIPIYVEIEDKSKPLSKS